MKNMHIIVLSLIFFICSISLAHAKFFGNLQTSYIYNYNFNGAVDSSDRLSESMNTYALNLGYYQPLTKNKRTIFIIKGGVLGSDLKRADYIDNIIYSANTGLYHIFNKIFSINTLLGIRAKQFDDENRNGEVLNGQIGFKQKLHKTFWFYEGVRVEKGLSDEKYNEYTGYGGNASINWRPFKPTLLNLGAGINKRIYDEAYAEKRTNYFISTGLVQSIGKHLFFRVGATWQENRLPNNYHYDTYIYQAGVGINF